MKVGSLFAGVGGFDIAAERAGMEVAFQSEYDKKASAVLDHHWPNLNLGDIHDIRILSNGRLTVSGTNKGLGTNDQSGIDSGDSVSSSDPDNGGTDDNTRTAPTVDVLCGGFPCQDYSVAGNRSGLVGDRGALWWEFHRLIAEGHPRWVVGENVPGLLSSRGGRDFATIIDSLTELGYGVVWRILDAQYYGVAQRRRRLFIVANSDGRPRHEVLALSEGLSGDPKPSREALKGTSTGSPTSTRISGHQLQAELIGRNPNAGPNGKGVTDIEIDPAYTINVAGGIQAIAFNANQDANPQEEQSPTLIAGDHSANAIGLAYRQLRSDEYKEDQIAGTLAARDYKDATDLIAFTQNQREEVRDLNNLAGALSAEPGMKQQTYINQIDRSVVRRLTPLECERLQGFPDDWTNIEGNSDSQRYKQMGNAVAVPVVEWIMKRIAETDKG